MSIPAWPGKSTQKTQDDPLGYRRLIGKLTCFDTQTNFPDVFFEIHDVQEPPWALRSILNYAGLAKTDMPPDLAEYFLSQPRFFGKSS
jgi:hypothetical protein